MKHRDCKYYRHNKRFKDGSCGSCVCPIPNHVGSSGYTSYLCHYPETDVTDVDDDENPLRCLAFQKKE